MSFEIKEVQIDSYNDTHNKLINSFVNGLNIICGPNEIGKSTLMTFIKNVFIRKKTDAKGYIKCDVDGDDVTLRVERNKLKENDKYINKITSNEYNTGFLIDLDDLFWAKSSDSEELINVIKDSSGNAVNKKQVAYYEYLYGKKQPFNLTNSNKASKSFVSQFEKLKEIETKIKELQTKEDEYNKICFDIEQVEKDISSKKKYYSYMNLLLDKNKLEASSKQVVINSKILEHKIEFDNIREILGALNSAKSKENDLEVKKNICSEKYNEKIEALNRIEDFDVEKIKKFVLNIDDLKESKRILDNETSVNQQINILKNEISKLENDINDFNIQKNELQIKLNELKIDSFEDYQKDKELLNSYRTNYSKLLDNYKNIENAKRQTKLNSSNIITILFFILSCLSVLGLLILSSVQSKIILAILGCVSLFGLVKSVNSVLKLNKNIDKEDYQVELDKSKQCIQTILERNNFVIGENDDFVTVVDSVIQTMTQKISEYKNISDKISDTNCGIQKLLNNKVKQSELLSKYEKDLDTLLEKRKELTEKLSIQDLENFAEIYEYIKDIQNLSNELNNVNKELDNTEKLREEFVQKVNEFIKKTELENIPNINKYDDFENILLSINKTIETNLENNRIKQEYSSQLENLNNELETYSNDIKNEIVYVDEEVILTTKEELDELTELKGRLLNSKENLENVSGLIKLQNEKMAEINKLKSQMNNIFVKQIVYNVIKKSKDKFNEIQPNLVSAKKFLSKITCGKYNEIDFEKKCISGENAPEKNWDDLSRGTKEQLYLALRLGYAENFSKDKDGNPNGLPELPLIIDDAFVNFDILRTQACIVCLQEFAQTHQVLYFTCHKEMIKQVLKDLKIKCNMIEL